jgi:ATP-dependent 26S proteasome regulatory subunit
LNVDTKIISKAIATKIKSTLPTLIKSDQTAYVKSRFIGESSRLIADVLELTKNLNIEGIMVTMDI